MHCLRHRAKKKTSEETENAKNVDLLVKKEDL
jgi:hypothetical protein